jgi:hypothetical protein
MNRPNIITSLELKASDLPPPNTSWQKLSQFALTFDPREIGTYAEKSADLGNAAESRAISELRAHLFVEQRRWNHFGRQPDLKTFELLKQVLEWLRRKFPQ